MHKQHQTFGSEMRSEARTGTGSGNAIQSIPSLPQVHRSAQISKSPPSEIMTGSRFAQRFTQEQQLKELHEAQQRELEHFLRRQQEQQQQLLLSFFGSQMTPERPKYQPVSVPTTGNFPAKPYKPYTLKQYQMLKVPPKNSGGLGPMVNEEQWKQQKERVNKMQEFAEQVKQHNHAKLKPAKKKVVELQKSQRQKALEFAKGIQKPKQRRRFSEDSDLQVIDEREESIDDLRAFEQRNVDYQRQLDAMR